MPIRSGDSESSPRSSPRMNRGEANWERARAGKSLVDVLDRVMDKGIVIDSRGKPLEGINLVGAKALVVLRSSMSSLDALEPQDRSGIPDRSVRTGDPEEPRRPRERLESPGQDLGAREGGRG